LDIIENAVIEDTSSRRKKAVDVEVKVDDPMEMITVIVQKPHGTNDSHAFFGFNGIEGQYAYDKPVKMPRAMVQHLRAARSVEYRPDDMGRPTPSYVNTYSIVDA
jgi:hypothetical protein